MMWPVDKMELAKEALVEVGVNPTGSDYVKWDRVNNRGFAHVEAFVVIRTITSIIAYGVIFFDCCINNKCITLRNAYNFICCKSKKVKAQEGQDSGRKNLEEDIGQG